MTGLAERVRAMAAAELPRLVEIRRHLHRNPELSHHEYRTTEFISGLLSEWGIAHAPAPLPTGVVATLGAGGGRSVGLRADIDALNISEENQVDYRSQVEGVMHACGHDGHTTMLLGAARLLSRILPELGVAGTVHCLFQPAEESPAPSGAQKLIEAGLLQSHPMDEIYALHLWPWLPLGVAATRPGSIMAAADGLHLVVTGRSGHAGRPHDAVDAVAITAHLLTAVQYLTDRRVDPLRPVAVTFGKIQGGTRHSTVAQSVEAWGTLRTMDKETREHMHRLLPETAARVAEALGATAELRILPSQPVTQNHPACAERALRAAEGVMGPEGAVLLSEGALTAEDFARFCREIPGALVWLGAGWPTESGRASYPLHHPRFDFPEEALVNGVALLTLVALDGLGAFENGGK